MDFTMIAPAECSRGACYLGEFEDEKEGGLVSWSYEMASGRKVDELRVACGGYMDSSVKSAKGVYGSF